MSAADFVVAYKTDNDTTGAFTTRTTVEPHITLSHLTPNTTYLIKVSTHMRHLSTPIGSPWFKFTTKARMWKLGVGDTVDA
jgi:hypothetical protein